MGNPRNNWKERGRKKNQVKGKPKIPLVKNVIAKAHVKADRKKKWNTNSLLYDSLTKVVKQVGSRRSTNRGGNIPDFLELMEVIRSKVH